MKKSHFGAGLLAGAIIGVAASLFANSPKGKKMTQDTIDKAAKLQAKLQKELKRTKNLTKAKYAELVDTVTAYYVTTKAIAKSEAPQIRDFLLSHWAKIEQQLKSVKTNSD